MFQSIDHLSPAETVDFCRLLTRAIEAFRKSQARSRAADQGIVERSLLLPTVEWRPEGEQTQSEPEPTPPAAEPRRMANGAPIDPETGLAQHSIDDIRKTLKQLSMYNDKGLEFACRELDRMLVEAREESFRQDELDDVTSAFWGAVDSVEGAERIGKLNAALRAIGSDKRVDRSGRVIPLHAKH